MKIIIEASPAEVLELMSAPQQALNDLFSKELKKMMPSMPAAPTPVTMPLLDNTNPFVWPNTWCNAWMPSFSNS